MIGSIIFSHFKSFSCQARDEPPRIRDVYRLHREELDAIDCNLARELTAKPAMNSYSTNKGLFQKPTAKPKPESCPSVKHRGPDERHKRMVELNVIEQCLNLFKTSTAPQGIGDFARRVYLFVGEVQDYISFINGYDMYSTINYVYIVILLTF